jgi:hypothetical protein
MGTILGRDEEEETTPVNPDLAKYRNEQAKLMMNQEFDITPMKQQYYAIIRDYEDITTPIPLGNLTEDNAMLQYDLLLQTNLDAIVLTLDQLIKLRADLANI